MKFLYSQSFWYYDSGELDVKCMTRRARGVKQCSYFTLSTLGQNNKQNIYRYLGSSIYQCMFLQTNVKWIHNMADLLLRIYTEWDSPNTLTSIFSFNIEFIQILIFEIFKLRLKIIIFSISWDFLYNYPVSIQTSVFQIRTSFFYCK